MVWVSSPARASPSKRRSTSARTRWAPLQWLPHIAPLHYCHQWVSLLWTHFILSLNVDEWNCRMYNIQYWYDFLYFIFTVFTIFTSSLWYIRTLKQMTVSDKKPHGLWEVSLMLRLFPTELKNKNVMASANIYHRDLSWVRQGQARPGAVGVRGEGDLWGCGGYRHLLAQAITEWHAHYRMTCLETRSVNIRNHILSERSKF